MKSLHFITFMFILPFPECVCVLRKEGDNITVHFKMVSFLNMLFSHCVGCL